MKRVGELYEVVVFTASVSKVCRVAHRFYLAYTDFDDNSTATLSWTSWISMVLFTIGYSEKAATTMVVTMSRICPRWAET